MAGIRVGAIWRIPLWWFADRAEWFRDAHVSPNCHIFSTRKNLLAIGLKQMVRTWWCFAKTGEIRFCFSPFLSVIPGSSGRRSNGEYGFRAIWFVAIIYRRRSVSASHDINFVIVGANFVGVGANFVDWLGFDGFYFLHGHHIGIGAPTPAVVPTVLLIP